jgi:hypothetical protein
MRTSAAAKGEGKEMEEIKGSDPIPVSAQTQAFMDEKAAFDVEFVRCCLSLC